MWQFSEQETKRTKARIKNLMGASRILSSIKVQLSKSKINCHLLPKQSQEFSLSIKTTPIQVMNLLDSATTSPLTNSITFRLAKSGM
jgi:hypothetical protein